MIYIGIAGAAGSGKDLFGQKLIELLNSSGKTAIRRAFADALKVELFDFTIVNYKISPFTKNRSEKELIRPLFIAHGNCKRKVSLGTYWINRLIENTSHLSSYVSHCVVPDLRFAEYEYDEVDFIKSNGGIVIFIERNGVYDYDENEAVNNAKIKKLADYSVSWGNESDEEITKIVEDFINKFNLC